MLLPTSVAQDQALRALAEIRTAIEKSTRYSTFSALSGFLAGAAALAGSGVCGLFSTFAGAQPEQRMAFVIVWAGVLLIASFALFVLTAMKAQQRGETLWTPIARTAFAALLGPGLAGFAGSAALIQSEQWLLLPGLWLLLYGCGLWGVSFFAPLFMRALGVAFMVLGICAWTQPLQSALWLGLGFGVLHLVFGAIVMTRYRQ